MQAQAGIQRSGDAEAGPEGWTKEAGGASRTRKRSSRRADQEGRKPGGSRARGSRPEEVDRDERRSRKAGAGRIGTSLGTDAECWNRRRKPERRSRRLGEDERHGPQGPGQESEVPAGWHCQRADYRSGRKARAGHLRESARGLAGRQAGDEGASRKVRVGCQIASRKAAGGLSGGEGRKPGAETQSEGKAGGTAARRCPEGETGRVGRKPSSNGSRRTSGREKVVG